MLLQIILQIKILGTQMIILKRFKTLLNYLKLNYNILKNQIIIINLFQI